MQGACGGFNNCGRAWHVAMNFYYFYENGQSEFMQRMLGELKSKLSYCLSSLYCSWAEFVDDGLNEAQFLIAFFRQCATVLTAQYFADILKLLT